MVYYTLGRVYPPQSTELSEARVSHILYDELLKENKDRIFNILFRLTGDHHTAEDLFQETFLRAYRGISRYEGKSKPSTWIYSIALNVYRDHYRRNRKSRQDIRIEDAGLFFTAEPGSSPEEAFLMKEERRELQALLVSLRPAMRVPVVLFYIEGLAVEEIAAVTGRSEPSIKTALHRARKLLKAKLGREG
jgi:RNA polymerase sigma-70 factor (ECF subfamily)